MSTGIELLYYTTPESTPSFKNLFWLKAPCGGEWEKLLLFSSCTRNVGALCIYTFDISCPMYTLPKLWLIKYVYCSGMFEDLATQWMSGSLRCAKCLRADLVKEGEMGKMGIMGLYKKSPSFFFFFFTSCWHFFLRLSYSSSCFPPRYLHGELFYTSSLGLQARSGLSY